MLDQSNPNPATGRRTRSSHLKAQFRGLPAPFWWLWVGTLVNRTSNALDQLYLDLDTENQGREGVVVDIRKRRNEEIDPEVVRPEWFDPVSPAADRRNWRSKQSSQSLGADDMQGDEVWVEI